MYPTPLLSGPHTNQSRGHWSSKSISFLSISGTTVHVDLALPYLTKHYFFYLKDISFASFRGKKWIFWKKIIYVLLVKQLDTQNPHLGARYHSSWFSCVRVDQMFCFDKRALIICLKMKRKMLKNVSEIYVPYSNEKLHTTSDENELRLMEICKAIWIH